VTDQGAPADRRVWVPYPPADFGGLPPGLVADVYGEDDPAPASSPDVEFYVLPYTFAPHTLEVMATMPRLRAVQTLTAGYEHVLPYLPAGVALCNARGLHDTATAELALALTLAAQNDLVPFDEARRAGVWDFRQRVGLADKTVLLVGYGSIGAAIARRLEVFECTVVPVARHAREGVAGWESLPELVEQADIVILIIPATAETTGLVDAKFLARMRDGALLVNVARGAVVDTDALVAELATGRLRAALDVTAPEPLTPGHPLWSAPNLLLTPHVGGNSQAFLPRAHRLIAAQLERFASGTPLANVVAGPTTPV
jgi:phosphoglycerate dehydrogenase-like enzyme